MDPRTLVRRPKARRLTLFFLATVMLGLLLAALAPAFGAAAAPSSPANGAGQGPQPGARELPDLRTATTRTFANPDGTRVAEVSSGPLNFRSADGKWTRLGDQARERRQAEVRAGPVAEAEHRGLQPGEERRRVGGGGPGPDRSRRRGDLVGAPREQDAEQAALGRVLTRSSSAQPSSSQATKTHRASGVASKVQETIGLAAPRAPSARASVRVLSQPFTQRGAPSARSSGRPISARSSLTVSRAAGARVARARSRAARLVVAVVVI